jgi:hypothetical protein
VERASVTIFLEEASMKEIEIDDAIRTDKSLLKDVERATRLFEEENGPSALEVKAEWRLLDFAGERKLELTITDQAEQASAVFPRSGLSMNSVGNLRILLIRLWGDLLQERSHKQIKKLMQLVHTLEED